MLRLSEEVQRAWEKGRRWQVRGEEAIYNVETSGRRTEDEGVEWKAWDGDEVEATYDETYSRMGEFCAVYGSEKKKSPKEEYNVIQEKSEKMMITGI